MKNSSSSSSVSNSSASSMATLLRYKTSLCSYAPEILIKTIIYASIFTILLCFLDVKTLIMLIAICFIFVICTFTIVGRSICNGLEEDELTNDYDDEFSNDGGDEQETEIDDKKHRKPRKYRKNPKKHTKSSSSDTEGTEYSTDEENLMDVEIKEEPLDQEYEILEPTKK